MKKPNIKIYLILSLFLLTLGISGCATPLPSKLNIVPPAPDVPKEIAAFSGIWKGTIYGYDTALVVEKINTQRAEVIISLAIVGGYVYATADVLPGPSIVSTDADGYKFIFEMDKGLNSLSAALVYPDGGKYEGTMKRTGTAPDLTKVELIECPSASLLPEDLKIVSPSPDVPAEIAAFSGIWGGKWGAMQDSLIAIEKINNEKVNIVVGFGAGSLVVGRPYSYFSATANVMPGPKIEWKFEKGKGGDFGKQCPCIITLTLNDDQNMLIGYFGTVDNEIKLKAEMVKCKEK